ncbi:RagB/SusD family nutrient uptake outer membrane protein [Muricauda sp. HICW]|uniref:RagB/SusD family nutrient uptake outer membrane protein n=1 Tax=Flagellimonas chongwuensis TaxID=2697365 RepID=A0A850NL78_9FLAO|nr:RagB/SusD family nutrient uptake outer membrane protein [Allomuricauda chongwuensis]NVN19135.1 RagB/SusD family nutrient uptake outer membrane protein [Allomuricauda chongwuensis]
MRRIFCYLSIVFVFISFSCSENQGDEFESEQLGSLEVKAVYESGTAIPDVTVSTVPKTVEKITNEMGKVVFNDIPVGNYEVNLTPSFSDVGVTIQVAVKENQVEVVEAIMGPDPISETPVDFDILLNNIYNQLKTEFLFDANGYSHYWGDIGTNIARINPNSMGRFGDLDQYYFQPSDYVINEVWSEHYRVIRLTNIGLDEIKGLDQALEEEVGAVRFESEFRFLRALLYFNLVKLYGNPILVTTAEFNSDNAPPHVQGREDVFDQIVDDLIFAQQNLSSGLAKERASKEAATALLGKVYLTMAGFPMYQTDKYALALEELEKIVGGYTLEENYEDVFSIENESTNTEVIFSIAFNGSGNYSVPWGPQGISFNDRLLLVPSFINSFFEEGDEPVEPVIFPLVTDNSRFYQNIATFSYANGNMMDETLMENWRPYKFIKEVEEPSVMNQESFDYPYLRMADVHLMIAEAENMLNGPTTKAYNALNLVRRRAYGDLNHDAQNGLSQEEFSNLILNERRLEFCFEGQFKDDLIRMNALEAEILNYNQDYPELARDFQSHEYIWPIPQSETNFNPNVVQNEGY